MTAALAIACVAAGLFSALLTDWSESWGRGLKLMASTLMITIIIAGSPPSDAYTMLIGAGLAASWVGDLALSFSGQRAFLVGLVAFALAHVKYAGSFFSRSAMDVTAVLFAGVLMGITAVAIGRWLLPHVPDAMRMPVTIYVAIISVMVVAAFGTSGSISDPRIPIAAVLFAGSDILVARQQFVQSMVSNRVVGLPLYFAAQALFAITVVTAVT